MTAQNTPPRNMPGPMPSIEELRAKRIAVLFNEWQRRYAADPGAFTNILDKEGRPISDYGERCAIYLMQLEKETGVQI